MSAQRNDTPKVAPFADAAWPTMRAGWPVIPITPGKKAPPYAGLTGADGIDLSPADVQAHTEERGDHGIAVRAPVGMVGIDIDQYLEKRGWANLENLRALHGLDPLPPTVRTSARAMPSGIRWFRLPEYVTLIDTNGELLDRIPAAEVRFDNAPVPGVELIQRHHRYGMVHPTPHPGLGGVLLYRWYADNLHLLAEVPNVDTLSELPEGWCRALGACRATVETPADNAPAAEHREAEWSPRVTKALARALSDLAAASEGGRYDTARDRALDLLRLESLGDPGATSAVDQLRDTYVESVANTRPKLDSLAEWNRHLKGGREVARSTAAERPTWEDWQADQADEGAFLATVNAKPKSNAPEGASPQEEEPEGDTPNVPDSWRPVDLGTVLANGYQPPRPELLRTIDETHAYFYRGTINGIHGEPGCGKTWVALETIAQTLRAGRRAMLLDYEANQGEVVARLKALGVTDEALVERFTYFHPSDPSTAAVIAYVVELITPDTDVAVIDSVGEAFGLDGIDENADAYVAPWLRRVARTIADAGPAVLLVDHLTKAGTNNYYPSGSKRKVAAITGATYLVKALKSPTRQTAGVLVLICGKDRHGTYQRGEHVANIDVTPLPDDGIDITVNRPARTKATSPDAEIETVARAVLRLIASERRPMSRNEVETTVRGKGKDKGKLRASTTTIRGAIDFAVGRGALSETSGKGNARMFEYVNDLDTPPGGTSPNLA